MHNMQITCSSSYLTLKEVLFPFSLPHSVKASLSLSPSGPGRVGSGGGSPTSKMGYCGGVPVEDMQALAITSLSAADVAKQYEHIRELGKGTYGKVDLVAHRTQGESVSFNFYLLLFINQA